jgi:hypothetical protein
MDQTHFDVAQGHPRGEHSYVQSASPIESVEPLMDAVANGTAP